MTARPSALFFRAAEHWWSGIHGSVLASPCGGALVPPDHRLLRPLHFTQRRPQNALEFSGSGRESHRIKRPHADGRKIEIPVIAAGNDDDRRMRGVASHFADHGAKIAIGQLIFGKCCAERLALYQSASIGNRLAANRAQTELEHVIGETRPMFAFAADDENRGRVEHFGSHEVDRAEEPELRTNAAGGIVADRQRQNGIALREVELPFSLLLMLCPDAKQYAFTARDIPTLQ
jgi:hypothetical protein